MSVCGRRWITDSNPWFKLRTNYFVEAVQNVQCISESTGVTGGSGTVIRSIKGMLWLGFSRQKELSSHVEVVLCTQPYPTWIQSFVSRVCFWFGWFVMKAQLRYCDVAFKRAVLSLSLWFISGPRCNCLILTCLKDSSHRKKGFLLEMPSRWD